MGCVGVRESISRQIPCPGRIGGIIPCSREIIPCSGAQGISSQITEFADVFERDFYRKSLIRRNSLHFSPPPGNYGRQEIVEFARNRNVGSKPSFYGDATPAGGALPPPIRRAAT